MRFGLLRVGSEPPISLGAALGWLRELSLGAFDPGVVDLGVGELREPHSAYTGRGGLGAWPGNGQRLAADVLGALDRSEPCPDRVVLVLPAGTAFRPHTWRLRGGGHHLGAGRWVRRYTLLPADAPTGTAAHELGHLLLGWPDLGRASGLGSLCLMAEGGHRAGGRQPAPPCAPLMTVAGWREPVPISAETTARDLAAPRSVGACSVAGADALVDWRDGRLVVTTGVPPTPIRVVAAVPCPEDRGDRPVLALLAPHVHRLGGRRRLDLAAGAARPVSPGTYRP